MRASILLTALGLLPCSLLPQTPIFGVVNSYHKVIGVDVGASAVQVDEVNGLSAGDRVMILQMKGASVNTTTTSGSFGTVTSLNNAGNYELATVCSVRNDSVFFLQQLLRSYTVEDVVQLVRIPRYTDAMVVGTLEAEPWDSTTGKGGVLAIIVSGTLHLHAPVTASARGFRGGSFFKDAGGCVNNAFQNYAYDPSPTTYLFFSNVQRGGWKGESIARLPLSMKGGRGALANGGGGGNNHNNAGGGGSNLTAAGRGGDNISTTGCQGSFAGLGGNALDNNGGEKIFFGGGGGAGHANNTASSTGGGHGGGIIFIQANNLQSNGFTISSNGGNGGNTSGDGASGGGAGGTIIMAVNTYIDPVSLEARGGNGGNEDDEVISGRCYGEGGGGGGGVVYLSGLAPAGAINLAGGLRGAKFNSTCAPLTGANGSAGMQVVNYEYMESTSGGSCAGSFLSSQWKYFTLKATGNKVELQWAVNDLKDGVFQIERKKQNQWKSIGKTEARENQLEYIFHDAVSMPGTYQYRIRYISGSYVSLSSIQQLTIGAAGPVIYHDAMNRKLIVKGRIEKDNRIRIIDLMGRIVKDQGIVQTSSEWQIDISWMRPGVYLVQAGTTVLKFIVGP